LGHKEKNSESSDLELQEIEGGPKKGSSKVSFSDFLIQDRRKERDEEQDFGSPVLPLQLRSGGQEPEERMDLNDVGGLLK
jgi:hypothetical protein